jgi:hypothetical protein
LLVGVVVVVAACSGQSVSGHGVAASSGGSAPGSSGPLDAAGKTYGYGAKTSGVDYQPDVVVVGGGASSIRSASANGLVWTIAKSAPGASKLKVGSVMLLTSVAAGRVAAISDDGDNRVVTLAPIGITDLIRNGSIDVNQALSSSDVNYQAIPDLPWASSTPQSGEVPSTKISPSSYRPSGGLNVQPAIAATPLAVASAGSGTLPFTSEHSVEIAVGGWKLTPDLGANKIALGIEHDGALKVGVDFAFDTANLQIHGTDSVHNGQSIHSGFQVTGITGLTVSLQAGAAGGSADNQKIKVEVPIDIEVPIPPSPETAGLPMIVKVSFKFIVETAITGNNSTLVATGKWALSGPIGIDGGTLLTPKFSVTQSILDSVTGITLGPSGIVIGVEMKFMVGIGTSAVSAGPFASIIVDLGVTNGSSLGASLVRCKGATLDLKAGAGVGLELPASAVPILKSLLPGAKYEYTLETSTTLLHRSQVVPNVPLCTA